MWCVHHAESEAKPDLLHVCPAGLWKAAQGPGCSFAVYSPAHCKTLRMPGLCPPNASAAQPSHLHPSCRLALCLLSTWLVDRNGILNAASASLQLTPPGHLGSGDAAAAAD